MKRHGERFLRLVDDAKARIEEMDAETLQRRLAQDDGLELIDVREDHEWAKGRIPGATHLGKGILERDIEALIPNLDEELVLYCGGGFRSALAADALRAMGYTRVRSLAGGFRGWTEAGHPAERE